MPSREKLIEATLTLLGEHGYRGMTTKAIAERAGLSEVTLFRRFGTKAELVAAALHQASAPFRDAIQTPSDDLRADIAAVTLGYAEFVDSWPALIERVLPEIAANPDIDESARSIIAENVVATVALVEHHLAAGRLVDGSPPDIVRALIGPLMARATLRRLLPPAPFDADAYTDRFLTGFATAPPSRARTSPEADPSGSQR